MKSIHTAKQTKSNKNNTPDRVIHQHRTKLGNPVWGIVGIVALSSSMLPSSSNNVYADSAVDFNVNVATFLELSIPNSVDLNLTPNSTNGYTSFGTTNLNISAGTNSPYGYILTMSASNTDLVNSDVTITNNPNNIPLDSLNHPIIPTITSTYSDGNFPNNAWGYRLSTSATYAGMPSTEITLVPDGNPGNATPLTLNLAAKVDATQPAGTYVTTINFATVAITPPTLASINNMQEMTPEICANTPTPLASDGANTPQYQLKDTRDNKTYWVAKLADGNCWMTQNLDLGGSERMLLTSSDTDLADGETFILPKHEDSDYPNSLAYGDVLTQSGLMNKVYAIGGSAPTLYDPGDQYVVGTNVYISLAECTASNTTVACEHGHVGNYYRWGTATALGSNHTSIGIGNAVTSICPKGWKLPTGGDDSEFINLFTKYGLAIGSVDMATITIVTSEPLSFALSDMVYGRFMGIDGIDGNYWTSTSNDNYAWGADDLSIFANDPYFSIYVSEGGSQGRDTGFSTRCIAR